jgi:protein-L-isoaspartate(D-aspartate) O-methyltransferase
MTFTTHTAREQMLSQQVRTWNVVDERVLQALRSVSRETFAPAGYRELAFADTNLPLAGGQVMLAPKLEGKILEAVNVQGTEQVLLIGAGSGHLAACLGQLAGKVRVIEYHAELADQARQKLQLATSNNVSVETGDATQLDFGQHYDVIIVTGSLPVYDERYQRALKVKGRLFAVIGNKIPMEAIRITRTAENSWRRDSLFETELPALPNTARPAAFVF